ncbi:MAG TPA: bacteriohemerythrin [Azospirillaceae bacterium]|nr:bacteriohemerythrin [Azospirillaceae bacterium]
MEWTPRMSVGVDILDTDHQRLFGMINSLVQSDARNTRDYLLTLLDELEDYTRVHFNREEEYMERCGYPSLEGHRIAHQSFVQQVRDLRREFEAGSEIMLRIDLILLLKDWLLDHIQATDQEYRPFVNPAALEQTA